MQSWSLTVSPLNPSASPFLFPRIAQQLHDSNVSGENRPEHLESSTTSMSVNRAWGRGEEGDPLFGIMMGREVCSYDQKTAGL